MPGIPKALLIPLRETLKSCDEFGTQDQLYSALSVEELRPWRDSLNEGRNQNQRVSFTIAHLADKQIKGKGNALAFFVKMLSDIYDLPDERHDRLSSLAEQIEWVSNVPIRPGKLESMNSEANPAGSQMIWISEAERMLECARSVARIDVQTFSDGNPRGSSTGTAWLLTPSLALTCRHVIEAMGTLGTSINPKDLRMQILSTLLTFDYTAGGKGLQYKISSLEYPSFESPSLDYAIIRLEDRSDKPLHDRGYLRLDSDSPLTSQTSLYIIQHPLGHPQQISGDLFVKPSTSPGCILYRTPTNPGTSGSPVFNRVGWGVVALHNGENTEARLREGLLMKEVLSDLMMHRQDIYEEIMVAQNSKE
ncbi:MAG: serine protease [Methanothrix sp.]|nr:serine protease [Methanothrix sp.]